MQASSRTLRQIESTQLSDCITCIDTSVNTIAVGCLDDNLYVWSSSEVSIKKQPVFTNEGGSMGIIDVSLNRNSTILTVSHMDSTIKLYPIDSWQPKNFECSVMENWKVHTLQKNFVTCGEIGRINIYDFEPTSAKRKLEVGDIFLTAVTVNKDEEFVAAGNNNGDLYIAKFQEAKENKKQKVAALKPHYKLIRELAFLEDSSKLLTASDDCSIKIVDISSEKVVSVLEGHKQAVSSIIPQQSDPRIVFSCSFDKTIKSWDLRMKSCVGTTVTASPLWDIKSKGKHLLAGGQNGLLNLYSVQ